MAAGKTHTKSTLYLSIPATLLAFSLGSGADGALACGVGVLAGVILSPDLDIDHRTHSEQVVFDYMGSFFGWFWFGLWLPYAKLIPHRHPTSHWPILGTILRLLYLCVLSIPIWGVGFCLFSGFASLSLPAFLNSHGAYLLKWGILGLMASDTLHYLLDILPFFKQSRK